MSNTGSNHSGDSDSVAMLAAGIWYLSNRNCDEFLKYEKNLDLTQIIKNTVYEIPSKC